MPDFPIELIIYEAQNGFCPYLEVLADSEVTYSINERNKHIQKLKFFELRKSDDLDYINGSPIDGLMELKYKIRPPYRAVAYFRGRRLFLLLLMEGSGSGGKINQFVRKNVSTIRKMIADINVRYE